jgi:hypothetical protein
MPRWFFLRPTLLSVHSQHLNAGSITARSTVLRNQQTVHESLLTHKRAGRSLLLSEHRTVCAFCAFLQRFIFQALENSLSILFIPSEKCPPMEKVPPRSKHWKNRSKDPPR